MSSSSVDASTLRAAERQVLDLTELLAEEIAEIEAISGHFGASHKEGADGRVAGGIGVQEEEQRGEGSGTSALPSLGEVMGRGVVGDKGLKATDASVGGKEREVRDGSVRRDGSGRSDMEDAGGRVERVGGALGEQAGRTTKSIPPPPQPKLSTPQPSAALIAAREERERAVAAQKRAEAALEAAEADAARNSGAPRPPAAPSSRSTSSVHGTQPETLSKATGLVESGEREEKKAPFPSKYPPSLFGRTDELIASIETITKPTAESKEGETGVERSGRGAVERVDRLMEEEEKAGGGVKEEVGEGEDGGEEEEGDVGEVVEDDVYDDDDDDDADSLDGDVPWTRSRMKALGISRPRHAPTSSPPASWMTKSRASHTSHPHSSSSSSSSPFLEAAQRAATQGRRLSDREVEELRVKWGGMSMLSPKEAKVSSDTRSLLLSSPLHPAHKSTSPHATTTSTTSTSSPSSSSSRIRLGGRVEVVRKGGGVGGLKMSELLSQAARAQRAALLARERAREEARRRKEMVEEEKRRVEARRREEEDAKRRKWEEHEREKAKEEAQRWEMEEEERRRRWEEEQEGERRAAWERQREEEESGAGVGDRGIDHDAAHYGGMEGYIFAMADHKHESNEEDVEEVGQHGGGDVGGAGRELPRSQSFVDIDGDGGFVGDVERARGWERVEGEGSGGDGGFVDTLHSTPPIPTPFQREGEVSGEREWREEDEGGGRYGGGEGGGGGGEGGVDLAGLEEERGRGEVGAVKGHDLAAPPPASPPTSATSELQPLLTGTLWKGDKKGGNWKKRFVALFQTELYYYQTRAQFEAALASNRLALYKPGVDLTACHVVVPDASARRTWPDTTYPVNLIRGKRTFYFAALDAESRIDWVAHLCACTQDDPANAMPDHF